ncbi:MAG TPA: DNA repair protein RecN [Pyrinomonadaceae bacterium]|nr:DNA repair protein RecN [Pyrinomonadaceae bacterium]
MLKFINIINLAVIHKLKVELHPGLCLLTGETGAGKSIIVDALGLLLGRRGGAELIRTEAEMALVEGVFEAGGEVRRKLCELLDGVGVSVGESEELIIRKELHASGRGRIFVNDQRVTAATLKLLQPLLLEIQGQGEQHALASAHNQLELLDMYAGCQELRQATARAYGVWRAAAGALRELRERVSERERLGDFLRYQLEEIEKLNPQPEEDELLSSERNLLTHAERALELCSAGHFELYESDESVLARLASVRKKILELAGIDARVEGWAEMVENASVILSEVADGLRGFGGGVDFSPQRLEEIEGRLNQLEMLKRKYRRDLRGLLDLRRELREQLGGLASEAEREGELVLEVKKARGEYLALARSLSRERHAAARGLEQSVEKELRQLAMERARFNVSVETPPEAASGGEGGAGADSEGFEDGSEAPAFSKDGIDRVEFFLSANVGESPRPLGKVASGGELSRLMLALRTVCAGRAGSDNAGGSGGTLIFDEIDAGIGGKAADAVGQRLKGLASSQQVLCVTHQAQIARYADHHYVVSKEVEAGRTLTTVRELRREERVGELARMISGSNDAEAVRETARWMLEEPAGPPLRGLERGRRKRV